MEEENGMYLREFEKLRTEAYEQLQNEKKMRNVMDLQASEINNLKTQIQKTEIENFADHKRKDKNNGDHVEQLKQ